MNLRKQAWIGPKIRQHEHIISCRISSQVVWHFVPCSSISELHFDWLITSEFLQNFFLRFQNFESKFHKPKTKNFLKTLLNNNLLVNCWRCEFSNNVSIDYSQTCQVKYLWILLSKFFYFAPTCCWHNVDKKLTFQHLIFRSLKSSDFFKVWEFFQKFLGI